jgi:aminoglycoside phosphotransferase (APT) family kinase protein
MPEMDVAVVREALARLEGDFALEPIDAILGGWSFWTFRVGVAHVVRFPRNPHAARGLEREVALLPELVARVAFRVPVPLAFGQHAGLPFALKPWIEGRAVAARDVVSEAAPSPGHAGEGRQRVADALAQLHGFPNQRAADLLGVPLGVEAWRDRYEALRKQVRDRVEPCLETDLRDRVAVGFERFLEEDLARFGHPTLVHGDLGVGHFRVDAAGEVVGMLDFETSAIGDPAIDFVGLQIAFGADVVDDVIARWGGPPDRGFRERLHFYVWMAAVDAILYGLEQGLSDVVADGIEGLRERIEA